MQLLQICTDYNVLPDLDLITIEDVRFFYDPIIGKMIEYQNKKNKIEEK